MSSKHGHSAAPLQVAVELCQECLPHNRIICGRTSASLAEDRAVRTPTARGTSPRGHGWAVRGSLGVPTSTRPSPCTPYTIDGTRLVLQDRSSPGQHRRWAARSRPVLLGHGRKSYYTYTTHMLDTFMLVAGDDARTSRSSPPILRQPVELGRSSSPQWGSDVYRRYNDLKLTKEGD